MQRTIGLIREGKVPADNRVALTPAQCKWIRLNMPDFEIKVQSSPDRCFTDAEYASAGMQVTDSLDDCDVVLGIKEVPVDRLIPGKTHLFFSHTRKKQPYNREMFRAVIDKGATLIDYECLEHEDGARIIGFGFFAGIVGAHNGIMAYGKRTGAYDLGRVHRQRSLRELMHTYFGLKLPNLKIAVTGSGRVAHGVLEVMNLMGIREVETEEFGEREFEYPVYVQLKGHDLYARRDGGGYSRSDFHANPTAYRCLFDRYLHCTDILMNGVYWDVDVPRLFDKEAVREVSFRIRTISDITDDCGGSVPINLGDQTIEDPVYGVDRNTLEKTAPYLEGSIDLLAVSNLPNELPRDASRYFGEQLLKYVLPGLMSGGDPAVERATMVRDGNITERYSYLREYAGL